MRLATMGDGMDSWAECVPNLSEGRDGTLLARFQEAIESANVALLDRHSDVDHHRSVFTFAGPLARIERAVLAVAEVAVRSIDLRRHHGCHPRIGALDVVPIVPLDGACRDACVESAWRLAERLWRELRLPVYCYGGAARSCGRRKLESVRKHGFEALSALARSGEEPPDVGEAQLHPTAGACCVGVRELMVALNVLLATRDARVARRIAQRVRESSGGLPGVKALGLHLETGEAVQVSMNLTRLAETPPLAAFEAVRQAADAFGVRVLGSELVGLAPARALNAAAAVRMGLADYRRGMILEERLADARARQRE